MTRADKEYLTLLNDILTFGKRNDSRAGQTLSLFGATMRFDISKGKLPLLTTKKVFTKGIIYELLWFLRGSTNIKYLIDNGVHIWDDDAYRYYLTEIHPHVWGEKINSKEEFIDAVSKDKRFTYQRNEIEVSNRGIERLSLCAYRAGDLGPIYGKQWRNYGNPKPVDQIEYIVGRLKHFPDDRRIILDAWNPNDLAEMALPPCHVLYQFSTRKLSKEEKEKSGKERALSCCFFMRSNDFTNGNPFNIAQAAILTHLLAHVCDMEVGELIFFGGDVHIYENNVEAAKEQLARHGSDTLPKLRINTDKKNIFDIRYEDLEIVDYYPDPPIKYNLNVG